MSKTTYTDNLYLGMTESKPVSDSSDYEDSSDNEPSDEAPEQTPEQLTSEQLTSEQTPEQPEYLHKDYVKLQRLAKKRKVFLIQKVTKRIKLLKAKKGNEAQLSKNQRKVDRLVQRIEDLKTVKLSEIVSDLVKCKFKVEQSEETVQWFKYELTQDKVDFMAYVNVKNGVENNDNTGPNRKRKRLDSNENSGKSRYSEKNDKILDDILKSKRNRPGQRARQKQWEEMYGTKAKHLDKSKSSSNKKPDGKLHNKPKEPTPQEIMKKLKEKEKKDKKEVKEHPSWVAKKQQASLSAKINVFAGTKTTFNDDDD